MVDGSVIVLIGAKGSGCVAQLPTVDKVIMFEIYVFHEGSHVAHSNLTLN